MQVTPVALLSIALFFPQLSAQAPIESSADAELPDLRAALMQWYSHRSDPSQYEDHFVPYRNALLTASDASPDLVAIVWAFDGFMETFAENGGDRLAVQDRRAFLKLVKGLRRTGGSLVPLLPYLLLLEHEQPDDPAVSFCLTEAWGDGALDCKLALAAVDRSIALLGVGKRGASAIMRTVVFELESVGAADDEPALLAWLRSLLEPLRQGQPLPPRALGTACLVDLDRRYAAAMQQGDFLAALAACTAMRQVVPEDIAPALLLELIDPKAKATFAKSYGALPAAAGQAVAVRLHHLGLGIIAPGLDLAAVATDPHAAGADYFQPQLPGNLAEAERRLKSEQYEEQSCTSTAKRDLDDAQSKRDQAERLQGRSDGPERARLMQRAEQLTVAARGEQEKARQFHLNAVAAQEALLQLQANDREVRQRWREFKLQ